jgi:uncharacterized protein (UPF0147 family)
MTINVKMVADSISPSGHRISTMQLTYPRFIHSEFMTHRMFSRNASSSRAIPVSRMLSNVWNDPATPVHWGTNMPGMQAREELRQFRRLAARVLWKVSGRTMCVVAWCMSRIGLHKQVANRLLEPWQHIHVVVTATEWDNFFALRCHPDAQPEFQELARLMQRVRDMSVPRQLRYGEWHLPYVTRAERAEYSISEAIRVSAARCCRVSYMNHDGKKTTLDQDLGLYNKLVTADPPHMSPVEHQATPSPDDRFYFNLRGWQSNRWWIEAAAKF